jgi:hypothetical protein
MNKITVVCHKDHSQGYEDFEGKCLLCVVDDLMLEIGNLMIQKRRAEKREWVGLTDEDINFYWAMATEREAERHFPTGHHAFASLIQDKLKRLNT